MKIKTSEATPLQLNWLVAKCEGLQAAQLKANGPVHVFRTVGYEPTAYQPSANWSQGGPIIERESIAVTPCEDMETWAADMQFQQGVETQYGPTPLTAAMRCYVASRLGDKVDVPEELM